MDQEIFKYAKPICQIKPSSPSESFFLKKEASHSTSPSSSGESEKKKQNIVKESLV